jgi:hypothetical protein
MEKRIFDECIVLQNRYIERREKMYKDIDSEMFSELMHESQIYFLKCYREKIKKVFEEYGI